MARRNPTNPDVPATPDWSLSPQQAAAVDLLASGQTLTAVAAVIEVTRQTVSGWVNQHPGFQAALHNRRQELWDGMADTLRALWRDSRTRGLARGRRRGRGPPAPASGPGAVPLRGARPLPAVLRGAGSPSGLRECPQTAHVTIRRRQGLL
jgi:hypothetical protein